MTYFKEHKNAAKLAWTRIKQSPLINLMSLLLITTALTLPSFLMVLVSNLQDVFSQWQTGTQMTLYLQDSAPKKNVNELIKHLELQPDIASVKYISPQEGLKEFRQQFQLELLDDIKSNPLPGVIIVQPRLATTHATNKLISRLKKYPLIKTVQFDQQWVKRLHGIIQVAQRFAIILALLLGTAIILIVSNAVHTGTQRYLKEIRINQLVGATNRYIRRPFLYASALLGISAGLLTWWCVTLLLHYLNPKVSSVAKLYNSHLELHSLSSGKIVLLLCLSTALSWLGATIASNRFIRNS